MNQIASNTIAASSAEPRQRQVRFNRNVDVFQIPNLIGQKKKKPRSFPADVSALSSFFTDLFTSLKPLVRRAKTQSSSSLSIRLDHGQLFVRDYFSWNGGSVVESPEHSFSDMLSQMSQYYRRDIDIIIKAASEKYPDIQKHIGVFNAKVLKRFNGKFIKESPKVGSTSYVFKTSLPKATRVSYHIFLEHGDRLQMVKITFNYLDDATLTPM